MKIIYKENSAWSTTNQTKTIHEIIDTHGYGHDSSNKGKQLAEANKIAIDSLMTILVEKCILSKEDIARWMSDMGIEIDGDISIYETA